MNTRGRSNGKRGQPNPHTQAGNRWHVVRTMLLMDIPGKTVGGSWYIDEGKAVASGMTCIYSPSGKVVSRVASGKPKNTTANAFSKQQRNVMTRSAMKTMSSLASKRLFSLHSMGPLRLDNKETIQVQTPNVDFTTVEDPGPVWIRITSCPKCNLPLNPDAACIVHVRWGTHVYSMHADCCLSCIL